VPKPQKLAVRLSSTGTRGKSINTPVDFVFDFVISFIMRRHQFSHNDERTQHIANKSEAVNLSFGLRRGHVSPVPIIPKICIKVHTLNSRTRRMKRRLSAVCFVLRTNRQSKM
jgi:hypothetical protein